MYKDSVTEMVRTKQRIHDSLHSPIMNMLQRQAEITEMFKPAALRMGEAVFQMNEIMVPKISAIQEWNRSINRELQPAISSLAQWQSSWEREWSRLEPTLSQFARNYSSTFQQLQAPLAQLDNFRRLMHESYNIKGVSTFYETLDEIGFEQVLEVAEELTEQPINYESTPDSSFETKNPRLIKDLTEDEFLELMEKGLSNVKKDEPGTLKKFFRDVLVNWGVELFSVLMSSLISYLYYQFSVELLNHHETVIFAIQKFINRNSNVKSFIKQEGYSEYKYINYIGVIRVETVLRKGSSRTAPVEEAGKLQTNTVVSILAMRGNWLKVQVTTDSDQFEGWVEKSKVIRFKKEK